MDLKIKTLGHFRAQVKLYLHLFELGLNFISENKILDKITKSSKVLLDLICLISYLIFYEA